MSQLRDAPAYDPGTHNDGKGPFEKFPHRMTAYPFQCTIPPCQFVHSSPLLPGAYREDLPRKYPKSVAIRVATVASSFPCHASNPATLMITTIASTCNFIQSRVVLC